MAVQSGIDQVHIIMKLTYPTDEYLKHLDALDVEFNSQIASAISEVYKVHEWTKYDLNKLIPGIKAEQWKRYSQQSYTKIRPAHVVGALSWISQVSVTAILRGKRVREYWPGTPENSIYVMARCGIMNNQTFEFFVRQTLIYTKLSKANKQKILLALKQVELLADEDYLAPTPLNIDLFASDYYYSSSIVMKKIRIHNNFTLSDMSRAFGVSVSIYKHFENADKPRKNVDSLLGFRFKNAFNVDDTTGLLMYMKDYPGFYRARKIQEQREKVLKLIIENRDYSYIKNMADRAKELVNHQKLTCQI